jgi:hypothetical protein
MQSDRFEKAARGRASAWDKTATPPPGLAGRLPETLTVSCRQQNARRCLAAPQQCLECDAALAPGADLVTAAHPRACYRHAHDCASGPAHI